MCLYPKLIKNKRYCNTKKNKGIVPKCPDERLRYVTAACGKCYECRKQKARAWLVRMSEETRQNPNALFVTLTITDEWFLKIKKKYNLKNEEECIKKMIRLWLERVRKQTEKSLKQCPHSTSTYLNLSSVHTGGFHPFFRLGRNRLFNTFFVK